MEPDETKNDAHGFGYTLVVGKRHGLVQRDFDHLDKLSLLWLTSTWADAVVIGHLSVKHGLLGTGYTDTRPGGETKNKKSKRTSSFIFKQGWVSCAGASVSTQHS